MVYQWKWSMPVAAQAAGEHLEKLESQNGGLTPKVVLEDSTRVYTGIYTALSETETREQVLREARHDMQSFREKYRIYTELSGVISEIDKLI